MLLGWVGGDCLAETDSTHGSNVAVLATPVGGVVEVSFLQDVVGTPVIGLLVNHPTGNMR